MQDKITFYFFPCEMEFIFCKPDIRTRAADDVPLRHWLVHRGPLYANKAYVFCPFKESRIVLAKYWEICLQK